MSQSARDFEWWRRGVVPKFEKSKIEDLPNYIPRPGESLGHKLPYIPGIGDEWRDVEQILQQGGGDVVIVEMKCCGCNAKTRMPAYRKLFDPYMKWLCEDCLDDGFDWASQLPLWASQGYQIVKTFKDDTLIRKLKDSPNPRDPEHRPVDASEIAKGLERKKREPL